MMAGPRLALTALFASLASAALAHEGDAADGGFLTGFLHPILGWDHIAAMVAVGLWGAFLGPPAIWLLPVTFPLVMALGGALGVVGVPIPGIEYGIAASALIIGVAVMLALRPPLIIAAVVVGFFAIFHGHAHGTEMPGGREPARLRRRLRDRHRPPASRWHLARPARAVADRRARCARHGRTDRARRPRLPDRNDMRRAALALAAAAPAGLGGRARRLRRPRPVLREPPAPARRPGPRPVARRRRRAARPPAPRYRPARLRRARRRRRARRGRSTPSPAQSDRPPHHRPRCGRPRPRRALRPAALRGDRRPALAPPRRSPRASPSTFPRAPAPLPSQRSAALAASRCSRSSSGAASISATAASARSPAPSPEPGSPHIGIMSAAFPVIGTGDRAA